mmetsp:Transcript_43814/g.95447  ORF Transcript_43814/g.95447 Transcript_43814/m.95447 type:complete len:247 (-) Transcript_43814:262-1002(-)
MVAWFTSPQSVHTGVPATLDEWHNRWWPWIWGSLLTATCGKPPTVSARRRRAGDLVRGRRGRGIASNSSRFTKEANAGSLGTIVASPLPCSGTWAGSRCQTSRGFFGSGVCPTADLNNWDADSTTRLAGELGIELSCSRCDQPESWTSFVTRESTDGGTASRGVGPQRAMRSSTSLRTLDSTAQRSATALTSPSKVLCTSGGTQRAPNSRATNTQHLMIHTTADASNLAIGATSTAACRADSRDPG